MMDNKELVILAGKGGGSGLSSDAKATLLDCFAHVAWSDTHGQDYVDALEAAFYPAIGLVGIAALYTQSGTVYDTDSLDSLKSDLVVTATYADNTVRTVTDYTLSGTLTAGTSTITVSYGGKTTTFDVAVSERGKSDMDGWTDGVAYTDLTIVENEYCKKDTGQFIQYTGWNRTGYVPCNGAASVTFAAMPQQEGGSGAQSNAFFDENHNYVQTITISKTEQTTITVPATAYYFVISSEAAALATCIENGIVPHE